MDVPVPNQKLYFEMLGLFFSSKRIDVLAFSQLRNSKSFLCYSIFQFELVLIFSIFKNYFCCKWSNGERAGVVFLLAFQEICF